MKWFALIPFLFLFSCENSTKEPLYVYCWAEYLLPELIEEFENTYNCRVYIDTFDSNESMFAKLKQGGDGYDLAMPSNYFVDLMKNEDLIQPIDKTYVKNLATLDSETLSYFQSDGQLFAVPFLSSYSCVIYRSDRVLDPLNSWNVFLERSLRGRMTMLSDVREVIGVALLTLGYSANSILEKEIKEATQLVLKWKQNLAKFESEQFQNGLATAEFLLSQGYSPNGIILSRQDPMIKMYVPKEGALISIDCWVLLKGAKHKELALAFLNFFSRPDVAAKNMVVVGQSTVNIRAKEYLPDEIKEDPRFFLPEEIRKRCEVIQNVGEYTRLYLSAWDEIKDR